MQIGGIEVKVGQRWNMRNGEQVVVEAVDRKQTGYPILIRYDNGSDGTRTEDGAYLLDTKDSLDLVELVNEPAYATLRAVLDRAFEQAAAGKGKERHARADEPFDKQVIIEGAKRFGVGSLLFQAFKKSEESQRLPADRAVAELLGAIVYLAAAVIVTEQNAGAA